MSKKSKIIIGFVILSVFLIVGCIFLKEDIGKIKNNFFPVTKKVEANNKKIDIDKKEEASSTQTVYESIENNKKENDIATKESKEESRNDEITIKSSNTIKNNDSQPKKQDTKVDKKPVSSEKNNDKKTTEIKPNKKQSEKKEESGVIDPNGKSIETENTKTIEPEPWTKIGLSKEDYYSKPVHSWMRVDYPVSSCENISKCESLCLNDAEELAYTENVSCIQVYTYSGSYLGEMLKRN